MFTARQLRLFFGLLAACIVIVLVDRAGYLDLVKSLFGNINNPIRRFLYHQQAQLKQTVSPVISDEQKELEKKELKIASLQAQVDQLTQESIACQKLLQSPLPADWQFVQAHILGLKDGTLLLDRGSADGVKIGDTVLVENFVIGKVSSVEPKSCQVDMVFSKNISFAVKTLGSQALGLAEYDARLGKLFVKQVLNEYALQVDEIVVTTGKKGVFPPGLVVGQVDQVQRVEAELYQEATIKPLVKTETLNIVFVKSSD